jgi:hypothetical protein
MDHIAVRRSQNELARSEPHLTVELAETKLGADCARQVRVRSAR